MNIAQKLFSDNDIIKTEHRKITCYDNGEDGFAEDMCPSGDNFEINMLPDRTLKNGVVVSEM